MNRISITWLSCIFMFTFATAQHDSLSHVKISKADSLFTAKLQQTLHMVNAIDASARSLRRDKVSWRNISVKQTYRKGWFKTKRLKHKIRIRYQGNTVFTHDRFWLRDSITAEMITRDGIPVFIRQWNFENITTIIMTYVGDDKWYFYYNEFGRRGKLMIRKDIRPLLR